ncbi:uncharacterized protein LOC125779439 [Bactrocera dorsalis]|uniref:Uncharacterized protein LOC125779439 n=1 Tax=Bactrocera dorsalis TaxID=27457 RepID=A0ABM3K5K0_BACDO|nr:uncharacterized protein LOC125779439 [Bactrocera dorsalis]
MKFLQITLQHAKAASANLLLRLGQDGADIVLIQEPWLTGNGISGLRTKSHRLLMAKDAGRNRACMLVRNELTVFLLPNFSNADIVTAKLECDTGDLWLISAYMPHDDVVEPPPLLLRRTLAEASKTGTDVIIGSDANSRHQIWGSSDTNSRGESLFDFIIGENLRICNRGNSLTFVTAGREEVLDLTLTSQAIAPLISDWRVLDDHSFSDHRYIEFSLAGEGPLRKSFRNPRNTDWEGYRRLRQTLLRAPAVDSLATTDVVEEWVEVFSSACKDALERSCPLRSPKGKEKPLWWTKELSDIRAS